MYKRGSKQVFKKSSGDHLITFRGITCLDVACDRFLALEVHRKTVLDGHISSHRHSRSCAVCQLVLNLFE